MTAPLSHGDELQTRMYASLARAIELAPVENKLKIFHFMCRTAVDEIAVRRQQVIDDLWTVAIELGLINTFGVDAVQDAFAQGISS
jgi:hypothetical protein